MTPDELPSEPTLSSVRGAAQRLEGRAHRTPVATSTQLDRRCGRRVYLKCENLQRIGAFKIRGATNVILQLPEEVAARGVVTHSSGNHGQAVALAARERGIPAWVVMPRTAARVKLEAVAGYGAEIVECEPNAKARAETAERVMQRTGATFVHPFDHPEIIAGQGTAALELLEEVGPLDALVMPIGGGGLAAGSCVAARALQPSIRLFAAEPLGADDAARSFRAGQRLPQDDPRTLADGLLTGVGRLNWRIVRRELEDVITVTEEEIVAAMRWVWERMKLVIEPSAAVAVAVVLGDGFRALDGIDSVGVIVSGGNVDLDRLPW